MDVEKHINWVPIPLTQKQVAIVSGNRAEEILSFNWQARWSSHTRTFYATRTETRNGKRITILMHRQILGLDYGDPRIGDHIEPKMTLDNRDDNLRIVTPSQNCMNRRRRIKSASGLKGVTFHKATQKWLSQIQVDGKRKHLGLFLTKEDAYEAYCKAAKELHGEFCRVA